MKLTTIKCPSCDGKVDIDIEGKKNIFCPYCGTQIAIDTEEVIITKNINIHNTYTDDARIEEARLKDKENEREHREFKGVMIGLLIFLLVDFAFIFALGFYSDQKEKKSIEAGMLKIGISSSELKGKKYQGIADQLESQGFTRVICIDLHDAGLFKNRNNTIESITVDGESSFSSDDYYYPDVKIVISYH